MAIDINIPSQVAQTITNGVTGTAPSQDAVYDALQLKENTANKGVANGYAPLNASTKIDSTYLPSYVDDVIEVANYAALPVTGETGKIYITIDTGYIYRWSGSIYVQIANSGGVWGGITGTLSSQTDLQSALDGKYDDPTGTTAQYIRGDGSLATFPTLTGYVPYTGATTDLDLGTYNLTADHIALNTSPSGAGFVVGSTQWNNDLGSSETLLKGGNVTLKNGVDLVARVVNNTGIQLTKSAYQVVKVSGAQGQRLAVGLARANTDLNSADTLGIVTETIANNQEGFIITVGQIEEINTTGSLQGETWADGDVLYLSPSTAGKITNIKPSGLTGHIVVLGYVEYSHSVHGKIYVKIMNGWELDELHNVYIDNGSLANNDILTYNSADSLWKNKTIPTVLGYTPVNPTRTISTTTPLSGGGDLSANRTLSIADAVADGTTKGAATFTASDFNSASGVISIDYTNGQSADGSNKGFLTSANWTTFNSKQDPITLTTTGTSGASTLVGSTLNIPQYTLANFSSAQNTASPNGTIYANSLSATSAVTNTDFAIIPKGTGALLAAVPDGTATGGNKRGNNAIDLQMVRSAANRVASGNNSVVIGGLDSGASGQYSIAGGNNSQATAASSIAIGNNALSSATGAVALGQSSTASGSYSVSIGQSNTASAANSVAIGYSNTSQTGQNVAIGYGNTASGSLPCVAMGYSATASGSSAISLGRSTIASGTYSVATGYGSNAYSIIGRKVHSPNLITTSGESQKSTFVLLSRTTGNTLTALSSDNGAASATNQLNLQNNNSIRFKGTIIGRQSGSTNTSAWDIDGIIQRGTTAASTTLLINNVTVVQNTPAWGTPTLVANTTLGGLTVNVTGVATTNIMWVATIETTEVIYA
jgi:hypothetical protein